MKNMAPNSSKRLQPLRATDGITRSYNQNSKSSLGRNDKAARFFDYGGVTNQQKNHYGVNDAKSGQYQFANATHGHARQKKNSLHDLTSYIQQVSAPPDGEQNS